ncbi:apolipoprotein D-like [Belonocnema kinseyi]|uniref:apolipoprotein D-like n=1 Tax=Belonocnema kinseyi TaxID=2817044 RepID=UPI00143D2DAB|nr:apolipoprotein D-like [Belonocnema kinseyi]
MIQLGFLLLLCTGAFAQLLGFGTCPDVKSMQNFNMTRYEGLWFETEKYFSLPELLGKCISASYHQLPDGSIQIFYQQVNILTKKLVKDEAKAKLVCHGNEAKYLIEFPKSKNAAHWILDTDYGSFSVLFACADISLAKAENVWILTREKNPPISVLEKAYEVLKRL